MSTTHTKQGFTLIELLVVIAILAILAGAILTVLNPAKQRAKASQSGAKSLAKQACNNIAVCNIEDPTGVCGTTGTTLDNSKIPGCAASGGSSACDATYPAAGANNLPAGVKLVSASAANVVYNSTLSGYACNFSCDVSGNASITATAASGATAGTCLID